MLRTTCTLVAALGLAAGCGGSSPPASTGVSLGALPARMAQTICAQTFKCASAADVMGRMESDCVGANAAAWQVVAGAVQSGESDGRLTYDAATMATCLTMLAGETCAEWVTGLSEPPACDAAITPKVATGGACQSDLECVGGHCLGADDSGTPATDGACVANLAHGAACTVNDLCVATDYCDGTTMICTAKKPGGAACSSDDECGNSCNAGTGQCSGYDG
jgi:hypothetical protein